MRTRSAGKRPACEQPEPRPARRPEFDDANKSDRDSDDDSDCSAADELELQLFNSRASRCDHWPLAEPPPEPRLVLEANGPWGAKASGVDIHVCDDADKGQGVHATKTFKRGAFVGMYVGECCTQRVRNVRHYDADATAAEQELLDERKQRLDSLTAEQGMPAGGSSNGGAYVFSLLPETSKAVDMYISHASHSVPLPCAS